jgi:hypothetical protein
MIFSCTQQSHSRFTGENMKRILALCIFVIGLATSAFAAGPTQIVFTWTYGATPVCSSSVTTSCITAFVLTDTTTSTVVSSTIAGNVTTFTYTPAGGIAFGYSHGFSLVATGVDGAGNKVTSSASTTTVTYSVLPPPTGLTTTMTITVDGQPVVLKGSY